MYGLRKSEVLVPLLLLAASLHILKGEEETGKCILRGETFLRDEIVKEGRPDSCFLEEEVSGHFRCQEGGHIHPQCMCNYSQFVFRGDTNEGQGLCKSNEDVKFSQITCEECKRLSNNSNGPCGNRGTYTCGSSREVAADIVCKCHEGYRGIYCDYKRVIMLCSVLPSDGIATCDTDDLKKGCITHNKNKDLFFKCSSLEDAAPASYRDCTDYEPPKPTPQPFSASIPLCGSRWLCGLLVLLLRTVFTLFT